MLIFFKCYIIYVCVSVYLHTCVHTCINGHMSWCTCKGRTPLQSYISPCILGPEGQTKVIITFERQDLEPIGPPPRYNNHVCIVYLLSLMGEMGGCVWVSGCIQTEIYRDLCTY